NFNAISRKLGLCNVDFRLDNVLDAEGKIAHRDLLLDAIADAVNVLVVVAGKMQDGLPHCFARDGAGINTNAADQLPLFDERYSFAAFGALDCRALTRRTRTNHEQIKLRHERLRSNGRNPPRRVIDCKTTHRVYPRARLHRMSTSLTWAPQSVNTAGINQPPSDLKCLFFNVQCNSSSEDITMVY